jgi:hypothetical protein
LLGDLLDQTFRKFFVLSCVVAFVGSERFFAQITSNPKTIGTARPSNARLLRSFIVPPSAITVERKPALPRNSFLLTENGLANGKPVNGSQRIVLERGRSATARDLVEGTNALEGQLNAMGYSLTSDASETNPILPVRANSRTNFTLQLAKLKRLGKNGLGPPVFETVNFGKNMLAAISGPTKVIQPFGNKRPKFKVLDPEMLKRLSAQQKYETDLENYNEGIFKGPDSIHREFTIPTQELGDPAWFGVSIKGGAVADGNMEKRTASASSDIEASILNQKISLMHGYAELHATKKISPLPQIRVPGRPSPDAGLKVELQVLGEDIMSPVNLETTSVIAPTRPSKSVSWEYGVTIPIIPGINAVGTFGATGTAAIDVSANATTMGGNLSLSPSIDTSIYAQVGISISLAVASIEGGVGASLQLLNYQQNFSVGIDRVDVKYNDIPHHALIAPIQASYTISALKGKIYGYAKIGYWLPFSTHHKMLWQGDLINWEGVSDTRQLLNASYEPTIIAPFSTAMPKPPKP